MTWQDDVVAKAQDFLSGKYEIRQATTVPAIDNVPFGKVAIKVPLTSLFVDLRNSTDLLYAGDQALAGKVHKAFLFMAVKTIRQHGGYIRSVNGDSVLAFWPAETKRQISDAVKAAMTIRGFASTRLKDAFDNYGGVDFGAGIDWRDVYVLRAGVSRDNSQNDLIFLGKSVNYAVEIGNQASYPHSVEISDLTHLNLLDDVKLNAAGESMWKPGIIEYRGTTQATHITSWYFQVE